MQTGNLDRRITVERAVIAVNDFGDDVPEWSEFVTLWAMRSDVLDGEKRAAKREGASLVSRFVVRSSSMTRSVTASDRLSHDGGTWDIEGVKETHHGRRRFLEITAIRMAD